MKYFVITTKHHEGFCLWDSRYTDYKASKTPWGQDLLKPMVEAFRAEGIRVGFYHSLIDWHHPQFPVDRHHPMRDNQAFRAANQQRDVRQYAAYLRNQVEELLTQFGQIDLMFFDFSYPGPDGKGRNDWQSEELIKLVRQLQPNILVDDRLDLMDVDGGWDYRTPEQIMVRQRITLGGKPVLWETCQTFSGSWGYHRDESTWKSVEQLLQMLIDTVSKDGNLLLNVGPTARGEFDDRALERVRGMGEWMKRHGRAIYNCGPAPEGMVAPENCRFTYNAQANRLYLHVFTWPIRTLALDGLAGKVVYAQLLNDASEVRFMQAPEHMRHYDSSLENTLLLELPVLKPNAAIPVIELFLR